MSCCYICRMAVKLFAWTDVLLEIQIRFMNPKVDEYISKAPKWQEEINVLRKILLDCRLDEELKWGKPCYMWQGKNIVVIQAFKAYFALLFFKGYLLKDADGILVKMGENTQVGRQMRFADAAEIIKMEPVLKSYIQEAFEAERNTK